LSNAAAFVVVTDKTVEVLDLPPSPEVDVDPETLLCPLDTVEVSFSHCQTYAAETGLPFERFVAQGEQYWSGCGVFSLANDDT
jgi:hypothetical protein